MTTMLMVLACMATWVLVALMLDDARDMLRTALFGRSQGGGWMPSSLPMGSTTRPASSRSVRRR